MPPDPLAWLAIAPSKLKSKIHGYATVFFFFYFMVLCCLCFYVLCVRVDRFCRYIRYATVNLAIWIFVPHGPIHICLFCRGFCVCVCMS